MADNNTSQGPGEIAMVLLGDDIPAIGPRLKTRSEAVSAVKRYITAIDDLVQCTGQPYRVGFARQADHRYTMVIKGSGDSLELLPNLDELTIKRFQKSFRKKIFIVTSFFDEGGSLECMALTEGLGAVMYVPW